MKRTMLFAALGALALAQAVRAEDPQEARQDAAQEVQKAKKDAAEKKADARKDVNKAEANAQKESREADQKVQEARQDASKDVREADRDQANDRNRGSDRHAMANDRGDQKRTIFEGKNNFDVDGRIQNVSGRSVTIARDDLPPVKLQIENYTAIEVDGNKAARTQLRQGQDVKASFNLNGDKPVAIEVKAQTKNK